MSYKDDLQKVNFKINGATFAAIGASFRGRPFFVDSSSVSGGRRTIIHEFPARNQPFIEEQGKKAREYSLDGYILGADYVAQRDALRAALEADGAGELIHPYYGKINAMISGFSIAENSGEGGFAKISISFVQVEKFIAGPLNVIDRAAIVLENAAVLGDNSLSFLEQAFKIAGQAQDFVDKILDSIDKGVKAIESAKAQARKIAAFKDSVDRVFVNLNLLIADVKSLGTVFRELCTFNPVTDTEADAINRSAAIATFDAKAAIYEALLIAKNGNSENAAAAVGTTEQSLQAEQNLRSFNQFLQGVALEGLAANLVDANFTSVQDAEDTRAAISETFEAFLVGCDDEEIYQNLQDLQNAIDKFLDLAAVNLRSIIEFIPNDTTPSLALIWDLYQNENEENDFLARNKIRNPLFLKADEALEVLTRG
jgi:prophage DNA circulation protein